MAETRWDVDPGYGGGRLTGGATSMNYDHRMKHSRSDGSHGFRCATLNRRLMREMKVVLPPYQRQVSNGGWNRWLSGENRLLQMGGAEFTGGF